MGKLSKIFWKFVAFVLGCLMWYAYIKIGGLIVEVPIWTVGGILMLLGMIGLFVIFAFCSIPFLMVIFD